MRKIPKHHHRIILTELYVKSILLKVDLIIENQVPITGTVKSIENSTVEIEKDGQSDSVEIDLIDELFLHD